MYATFLSDAEIQALPRLARPSRESRLREWTLFGCPSWRTPNAWNARLWYSRGWNGESWLCDGRGRFTQPSVVRHVSLIRVNPNFTPYRNNYQNGPILWVNRYVDRPVVVWADSRREYAPMTPLLRLRGWNPVQILAPLQGRGASVLRTFVIRSFQACQRDTLTTPELL